MTNTGINRLTSTCEAATRGWLEFRLNVLEIFQWPSGPPSRHRWRKTAIGGCRWRLTREPCTKRCKILPADQHLSGFVHGSRVERHRHPPNAVLRQRHRRTAISDPVFSRSDLLNISGSALVWPHPEETFRFLSFETGAHAPSSG